MSALAIPVLIPVAVIALVLMGRRRAAWWVVPVLWPSTQWYYTSLAMPGDHPAGGVRGRRPVPFAATLGAVVVAAEVVWRARRAPPADAAPVAPVTPVASA